MPYRRLLGVVVAEREKLLPGGAGPCRLLMWIEEVPVSVLVNRVGEGMPRECRNDLGKEGWWICAAVGGGTWRVWWSGGELAGRRGREMKKMCGESTEVRACGDEGVDASWRVVWRIHRCGRLSASYFSLKLRI